MIRSRHRSHGSKTRCRQLRTTDRDRRRGVLWQGLHKGGSIRSIHGSSNSLQVPRTESTHHRLQGQTGIFYWSGTTSHGQHKWTRGKSIRIRMGPHAGMNTRVPQALRAEILSNGEVGPFWRGVYLGRCKFYKINI